MSIRLPLQTVLDVDLKNEVGAGSVAGGIAKTFVLPQDTDNIVVKFTASTVGAGSSVFFQTSDDGGTTWYDVARTSIVSNANNTNAEWLNIGVNGLGFRTTVISQTSVAGATNVAVALNTTGRAAASSLGVAGQTGLPIMSQVNRVFFKTEAAVSANTLSRIVVDVNSQSAR
jgi:hypothetical protein